MENRLENLRIEIDKLIMEKQPDEIRYYVSHLYGVARFCTLLAMKRNLNAELAATCGMLHDIYQITDGIMDNHGEKGAERAEKLLNEMNAYNDDEIKIITTAISNHSDKSKVQEPYDELLKDADVMDHCFYNTDFPIAEREVFRYKNLLIEFGLTSV